LIIVNILKFQPKNQSCVHLVCSRPTSHALQVSILTCLLWKSRPFNMWLIMFCLIKQSSFLLLSMLKLTPDPSDSYDGRSKVHKNSSWCGKLFIGNIVAVVVVVVSDDDVMAFSKHLFGVVVANDEKKDVEVMLLLLLRCYALLLSLMILLYWLKIW